MTPAGSLTPIELLLPGGRAGRAAVLGSASPDVLVPETGPGEETGPLDLMVLAPTDAECERSGWVADAAAACAERLDRDGFVYALLPRRARRIARRKLRANGFEVELVMLHLPDVDESRLLVPLEPAPARYAFSRVAPLSILKRGIVGLLLRAGAPQAVGVVRGKVALLARRADARPLLDWLPLGDVGTNGRRTAVITRSPRAAGSRLVIHPFVDGTLAPVVVKLRPPGSAGDEPERGRLERIGAVAAQAGVGVPRPIDDVSVNGAEFTVETRVEGEIAAPLLARDPSRLEPELRRVCEWLGRWTELTARAAKLDAVCVGRELLDPARRLAPYLEGGSAYVARLEERAARLVGTEIPLTAAHNDLTMWNVLVDGARISIIDWESAEDSGLPLTDFFYLVADAVWATGAHETRVGAVRAAFEPGGTHSELASELQAVLGAAIGATDEILELSLHACWLKHGAYEVLKHPGAAEAPFRAIAQWLCGRES